ncbi:hypothetical protein HX109_02290 [Galbibacter sp. BG1]|uniref:hypothetical protein n=1 Tax=Galbibacter sp. BG1 TaxID=1170699 RepID=UPI0015BE32E3|nr:hypothetical protein [Galbibacter sp. BG1]QLE00444.1 hypothetical protein HX109_02290 [Galbibacter sp. BG1]
MKNLQHKMYSVFVAMVLTSVWMHAQKETKTYNESFNVNSDVVLDINTSYADVEFDTWNKNKVEVEAVIEVEGLSKEEAAEYFKNWGFKAQGNSGKVTITTSKTSKWSHGNDFVFVSEMDDMVFAMPDSIQMPPMPPMPPLPEMDSIMVVPPVPPMPPLPMDFDSFTFDYEAYKKDGDAYLKEWKKKFNDSFDDEVKANLEEWKKEVKEHQEEWQVHRKEMMKDREQMQKEREKQRVEIIQIQREAQQAAREAHVAARKAQAKVIRWNVNANGQAPNVFYYKSGTADKNLKVKKTIKIKMPKGAKLKMNIRHGEVTLAENYSNINATLSYTRLHAPRVCGESSVIEASYSPVMVENWDKGELKANYVESVQLEQVKSIKLTSKSSNVIIENLIGDALINGSFGDLTIGAIANDFTNLNIVLDNSDAILSLPKTAFTFYSNASNSSVKYPKTLSLKVSKNYNNEVANGYFSQKNSNKTINLVANYSDVVLQ